MRALRSPIWYDSGRNHSDQAMQLLHSIGTASSMDLDLSWYYGQVAG